MCGIVGFIGKEKSVDFLINGLKRVEYRGYDSAGISILNKKNEFTTIKSVGKIATLEEKIDDSLTSELGIAHTRWATHGEPNEINCHPHTSNDGSITLVHNGIIENYNYLKKELEKKGFIFYTDTDTEVLVNLVQHYYKDSLDKAVRKALQIVEGTYGIGVMSKNDPDKLVVAKLGSPLLIGVNGDSNYFASDASSIISSTRNVVYLNDKEMAVLYKDKVVHKTLGNINIESQVETLEHNLEDIEKNGYDHFMLKEIFEQPRTIKDAIRGRLLKDEACAKLGGLRQHPEVFNKLVKAKKIFIVACGTSWHSGLIGKYMLEEYTRISVEVEYASEFRYRDPLIDEDTIVMAITQSGETADTLAALKEAKRKGATTIGVCNVVGSSIAKETDAGVYLHAGPEIGVASTKAFTSQVTILALITLEIARKKYMDYNYGLKIVKELLNLPNQVEAILEKADKIKEIANLFINRSNALYLGRGYNFPVALEGALKLKEISYIHAEGYPAAEMKHGPIALIDENMPVICIAIKDSIYDKVISNIKEVKARKGKVIAIASESDTEIEHIADYVIKIPESSHWLMPILTVIPLQLLSYYVAVNRGCNVDMPRNLAKSVTVE